MSILSKQSVDSVSVCQNCKYFSQKWTILKFVQNHKILNSHRNLEKKNKAKGITLPDFKLYYGVIVIKTIWYCHKNSLVEQNREPRNKPIYIYNQLIYDKKQDYTIRKGQSLQYMVLEKLQQN